MSYLSFKLFLTSSLGLLLFAPLSHATTPFQTMNISDTNKDVEQFSYNLSTSTLIGSCADSFDTRSSPSSGTKQLNPGAAPEIFARCHKGMSCSLYVQYSNELFVLTDCGRGSCPSCPANLGNLIVKNWCAYTGISTGRKAIILHLAFGSSLGPFLVP